MEYKILYSRNSKSMGGNLVELDELDKMLAFKKIKEMMKILRKSENVRNVLHFSGDFCIKIRIKMVPLACYEGYGGWEPKVL